MYSGKWSPGLRQGDVFGPFPFPYIKATARPVTRAAFEAKPGAEVEELQIPAGSRFIAVLSHDCEFNEGKRVSFLVARLINLNANLTEAQRQELRAANDALEGAEGPIYAVLNTFVVDAIPGVLADAMQIDFASMTSFPMKAVGNCHALKRAELDHEHRVKLRRKLAFYFGRDADDIPDDEKADPPAISVPEGPD